MNRPSLVHVSCSLLVAALGGWVCADHEADLVPLCAKVKPAFVFIAGGSGVVISPDGVMLTNNHVIAGKRTFDVRLGDGSSFKAKLLGTDPHGDLAALRLELKDGQTVPHLPLGDSDALAVGDETLAVGNPFGLGVIDQSPTFTAGIVSALHHTQGTYTECIVTDTEVNPGNSGGPLITMNGAVVGINGQIATRFGLRSNTGLGFAISAKQAKIWLPRLKEAGGGEVKHGRIPGLAFEEKKEGTAVRVVIKDVAEGSAAATIGFQPGDRVLGIEHAPIPSLIRLAALIGMYPEGHEVKVAVDRDGKQLEFPARLVAPKRCALGFNFERPKGDDLAVVVSNVESGTPAATAGVKEGDQILEINGSPITLRNKEEFKILDRLLRASFNEGDVLAVKVRRTDEGKDPVEVELRLIGK